MEEIKIVDDFMNKFEFRNYVNTMFYKHDYKKLKPDDERWSDIMYQAEVCLDKWNAVPNPSKTWYGWNNREKQKKKIYYFN